MLPASCRFIFFSALILLFTTTITQATTEECSDGKCIPIIVSSLLLSDNGPDITFQDQQLVDVTVNGGLETGSFADGGWEGGYLSIEENNVNSGNYAGRLYTYYNYPYGSYRQAVTPGENYTFSCAAASADLKTASSIYIRLLDSTESTVKTISVVNLIGTHDWRTYTSRNFHIPDGVAYIDIRIVAGGVSGSSQLGGYIYFDDFKLQRNTGLPIDMVATYESAGLTVISESDEADCDIYFREADTGSWHQAYAPMFDDDDTMQWEFRGSIVSLKANTDYQAYAILKEGDTVIAQGGISFHTWDESPNIGKTYTVAELVADGRVDSAGRLDLTGISGTKDAWVKISGTGSNDFDGDYAEDEAIYLYNNQYVILENIQVTGGRRYGIHLERCHQVRIINCDISGWARTPGYTYNGRTYESETAYNNDESPINLDGGIFLDTSSGITVERCYLHDQRLSANSWDYGHPYGPEGLVIKGLSLSSTSTYTRTSMISGNHVVRYNDIIGSDTLRFNDGIEGYSNTQFNGSFTRDSDIYGNMIAFGQDDVIELDGGQENVRFFGNKGQNFLCGVSIVPNRQGPSYLFRNAIVNLGDARGTAGTAVKAGGGDYSKGFTYIFNNTFHNGGYGGIYGVHFQTDSDNLYHAVSRNNIVYARYSPTATYKVYAISDVEQLTTNSFDYDNLVTGTTSTAKVLYSDGQETHGILDNPPTFVDMDSSEYHDDLRLAGSSSAIDAGTILPNFSETFSGSAPDQGALERGDDSLLPIRPIAVTADRYRIVVDATAGGASDSQTITLSTADLGDDVNYTVRMNDALDWLNVTPTSGELATNSSASFTFTVNTDVVDAGTTRQGIVLIRLESGYSIPITVVAHIN